MVKPQYGPAHQRARRAWAAALPLPCVFCGRPIPPGAPFDLDHLPGTDRYRGVACPTCNRRDGAIRGNTRRRHRMTLALRNAAAGLDLARDRSRTALVLAGHADHPHDGEVLAAELFTFPGVASPDDVIAAWQAARPASLAVNGVGHVRVLSEPLSASVRVHEASAQDMADAHGRLLDTLRERRLRLPEPHPELDEAVRHALSRDLADGAALDKRRAETDLAPLVALELAVWAVLSRRVPEPFFLI